MAFKGGANSYGLKKTNEIDGKCSFVITLDNAGKIKISSNSERSENPVTPEYADQQSPNITELNPDSDQLPQQSYLEYTLNQNCDPFTEQQQHPHKHGNDASASTDWEACSDARPDIKSVAMQKFVKVLNNQRQQRIEMKPSFVVLENAMKHRCTHESISIQTAMDCCHACNAQQQTLPFDICAHAGSQTDELLMQCAKRNQLVQSPDTDQAPTYCSGVCQGNEFKQNISSDLVRQLNHMQAMQLAEKAQQPIDYTNMEEMKYSMPQQLMPQSIDARHSRRKSGKRHITRAAAREEPLVTPVSSHCNSITTAAMLSGNGTLPLVASCRQNNHSQLLEVTEQYAPRLHARQHMMQPQCQTCKTYQQLLPQLSIQSLQQPLPQLHAVASVLPTQIGPQLLPQQQAHVVLAPVPSSVPQLWLQQANNNCTAVGQHKDAAAALSNEPSNVPFNNLPRVTISLIPLQLSQPTGNAATMCSLVASQQPQLVNNNGKLSSQPSQPSGTAYQFTPIHSQCNQHVMQKQQQAPGHAGSATRLMAMPPPLPAAHGHSMPPCLYHQASALNMACGMPHCSSCRMHQHHHAHTHHAPCYNAPQQQWRGSASNAPYTNAPTASAGTKHKVTDAAIEHDNAGQPTTSSVSAQRSVRRRKYPYQGTKQRAEVPPNRSSQTIERYQLVTNTQQSDAERAASVKHARFLGGEVAETTEVTLRKMRTGPSINACSCYSISRFRRSRVMLRPAHANRLSTASAEQ